MDGGEDQEDGSGSSYEWVDGVRRRKKHKRGSTDGTDDFSGYGGCCCCCLALPLWRPSAPYVTIFFIDPTESPLWGGGGWAIVDQ